MTSAPILYEKLSFTKEKFFQGYLQGTKEKDRHVLLESGRTGKYSIAGMVPFAVFQASGDEVMLEQEGKRTVWSGKPLVELEKWMEKFSFSPILNLPDFQGGAVGYISYDYAWSIEKLPNIADNDLQLPEIYFQVFDEWAVFDHEEKCLWIMVLNRNAAKERLALAKKKWLAVSIENSEKSPVLKESNRVSEISFTEEEFVTAVEKIQAYIAEGDVFQVNLTVRQSKELSIPSIDVYKELRRLNPSPYMGYLHTPEFQIISGSPELLIKKAGDIVSTRPIAGTRPRGINDEEDQRLANELIGNEKEQAEHIMLVDLERNDLGKVCAYGSVKVDELMTVEKYSHVMHIVSHVSGRLAEEKSAYDLIEAVFPGGTITGAPKVRTLEIIEELEPVKRGVYTGSLGWIGFNEDLHLNIVIRTMLVKEGICHVQAGAGIVIDSDPKAEYEESLRKAHALWKAKEVAESKVEKHDFNDR
ncbi:anthranilate synthase component I family protein [Lederbergia lenta]|uniref:Para-aminobenzoate synthase component I n=1 Tax=Lederbergia lenta TaxID=1467 RepID=A0A2X4VTS4_LEDLE|nr:anthranilate synthase component I family protein [Lederbergia lenta]MCM3110990.1 anthranilate synthase component I family protein [Lederbergia lenta]MEC2325621.1 anthranilate synthase component I family protein [Lederbergia lenta]SQI54141.1 para-aminobenzoate synthase component I [Lederbergia lenta]